MLVYGSGKVGSGRHWLRRRRWHPRQRQHFRLRRRVDLPLDLNSEATLNRSDHLRADVVLHPTDDDLVGEIGIRDERHRRVQRGVGEIAIVGSVAFAIVCEDGVAGAGDHIGLPVDDGVSDEAGGGPSVCDGHIVKILGSIWVHGELEQRTIQPESNESENSAGSDYCSSTSGGEVGCGGTVGGDEVSGGANGQFV